MASPDIHKIYHSIPKDANGHFKAAQLQQGLQKSFPKHHFDLKTAEMMIAMFDADKSGTITLDEFIKLNDKLNDWTQKFQDTDTAKKGHVNVFDLKTALHGLGYNVSNNDLLQLNKLFDPTGKQEVKLEDYVQICVQLEKVKKPFDNHSKNTAGTIQLTFEEYLSLVWPLIFSSPEDQAGPSKTKK